MTILTSSLNEFYSLTYSGYKPHSCPYCKASFARQSNLKRHITTNHSEVKPFRCTFCSKEFSRKDDMERHVRTHTGDKPYTCMVCDKSFSIRSSLTQHLRLHTGERPYVCEICHGAFSTSYNYHRHVKHCSSATMIVWAFISLIVCCVSKMRFYISHVCLLLFFLFAWFSFYKKSKNEGKACAMPESSSKFSPILDIRFAIVNMQKKVFGLYLLVYRLFIYYD